MNIPQTASGQWDYKANMATRRAPSGKGWAKYLSSNGWPKVPPRLAKHVGARVEDRISGKHGTVLRGTQNGWLIVEYDDQSMGTPTPGQLEIVSVPKRVAVKRMVSKSADLEAQVAELEALLRIAERRISKLVTQFDDDKPVIRTRWAA